MQAWLAKQEARQIRKRNQYNSFVPSMPMEQIQVDLADMGTRSKNRFAFVAIDPYTKKADAVPIPNKLPGTTAKALDEALKDLGPDWPAFCLHDEGGEFEGAFSKRLQWYEIQQIRLRTHPRFVERFIRTLKDGVRSRREAHGGDWTKYVEAVLRKYNSSVHSAVAQAPNNVDKTDASRAAARLSMSLRAKNTVKRPPLSVGDQVRRALKRDALSKAEPNWSRDLYRIEKIERNNMGQLFYLEGAGPHPFLRHELQLVREVQKAPGEPQLEARLSDTQMRLRELFRPQALELHATFDEKMSVQAFREKVLPLLDIWRAHGIRYVVQFLQLFPDIFRLSDNNQMVEPLALAEEPETKSRAPVIAEKKNPREVRLRDLFLDDAQALHAVLAKAGEALSLTKMRGYAKDKLEKWKEEGVNYLGDFFKLFPDLFRLSRNNMFVEAI